MTPSKKDKIQNLPELNVGIVGHIDHGKTTLLHQLTGKFTDTHSEELKRGITIKLGYADTIIYKCGASYSNKEEKSGKICTPERYVSFIDAPGHEMLMATMLSGAATMDAAILLVAANEGIKPQTKEHCMALQTKKIKNVIIVQNKIDLVSKEQALKNYKDIKEFIKGTPIENSPVIPVSAQQGVGLEQILEELTKIKIPGRNSEEKPIFLVARSFDINKPGTKIASLNGGVLGGILKRGTLKVGDTIEIKPGLSKKDKSGQTTYQTLTTKILSLHRGNDKVPEVTPGSSISIETELDSFLTKTDSLTGCVVSLVGALPGIAYKLKLKSELFKEVLGMEGHTSVEAIKTKETLMLSVNTTTTVGTVEKISKNEIELQLSIPVVALKGDNVGIARNMNNHWRLIGMGEVLQ